MPTDDVTLSADQLAAFSETFRGSHRLVQPRNGREVTLPVVEPGPCPSRDTRTAALGTVAS